ncbi:phosphomannomutase/phosphoglucomutase [Desulfobaculum xiamenense]|uniref:Phosphomannomutase/phosphoglucomutase n=1 Tax=Desulfobaculum xiamenense TaxID=995050 RepID=A0A846QHZ9_9BACT|nr:phosphomannomutase/phosphoglucomutase [Desulfobaculum xiamenense]NJB67878.1 phosphomannomutase/phosphoglucomutase [Desulfobaculum xiamenense]
MKAVNQEIFRAYDIRGVVDVDFDAQWVETLGKACGTYFKRHGYTRAVVAHDCRHSSPQYQKSIISGLTSTGVDVLFLNMVATPLFYFGCKTLGYKAGVMITASHNPPEFNGFKVWAGETTIHSEEIQEIYRIMAAGQFETGNGVAAEHDIVPSYLDELAAQIKLKRPVRVVLDGGNGAAGEVCRELLQRVGAEVIDQYCEPDGDFPNHHPDPIVPKYMTDLIARVKKEGAELGIGLDGDGDRIGVIDEKGDMIYGDKLLTIFARSVLERIPGATVIGEVKCTHLMYADIAAHGGVPIMGQTGHSLIKARMQQTGAQLAGEMSGHMFFADRYYGFDDGCYAALRIVEIVSGKPGVALSTYLADWPVTYNTPEIRTDCPDAIKFDVVRRAQDHFRKLYDIIDVDGVRITFPDGWGLLRASNTQPVLVLRFEAESPERLEEIRKVIEVPLAQWIREMS